MLLNNKQVQTNKRLKQQRTSCETSNWKEFWFSHRRCSYLLHTLPWNLSDKKGNKNFSRKISDKKTAFFSLSQLFWLMDEDHLQCSFLLPDEEVEDDFPNRVFVFLFFSFSLSHLFNKLCKGPKGICIFIWMTDGWMMIFVVVLKCSRSTHLIDEFNWGIFKRNVFQKNTMLLSTNAARKINVVWYKITLLPSTIDCIK